MIAIICFFTGLFLLASGEEIVILTNIGYISIMCNVLSCGLMGYGVFDFFMKRNEEIHSRRSILEEISLLLRKVSENEEHERSIELINKLCSGQIQYKNSVDKLYEKLKEFMEFYQSNVTSNEELQSNKREIIIELQNVEKTIGESTNKVSQDIEMQINELKSVIESQGKSELESKNNFLCQIELLQKEIHTDNMSYKEALDEIRLSIIQLGKDEMKNFENVLEEIKEICHIPQEFSEQMERLIVTANKYTADLTTKMEYLSEDLEEQDKKRMNNFNRMLEKLEDYGETRNEELMEEIKTLSQQYLQFEQTVEIIVQKLTAMTESDIEVMKGFLNG